MESNEPLQTNEESSSTLPQLVEKAQSQRLSPAEEERVAQLLQAEFLLGKTALAPAISDAVRLPWMVGVTALIGAWTEMKPTAQKSLLVALRKETSDSAPRLRLSFARALFKIDPALAAKQTAALCAELLKNSHDESSANDQPDSAKAQTLAVKFRHLIFNVLIGKGKPWLLHLPIDALKADELAALIRCAIQTGFESKGAPFTQLALIEWLANAANRELLTKLDEDLIAQISQCVEKWNARWKKELAKIENLPAQIQAAAVVVANREPAEPQKSPAQNSEKQPQRKSRDSRKDESVSEEKQEPIAAEKQLTASPEKSREPRREGDSRPTVQRESHYPADEKRERQSPRADRERSRPQREAFHFPNALKQIDSYVASLQNDLAKARAELKQVGGKSDRRPRREEADPKPIGDDFNAEELRRHNAQLEATISEMRQHLDEMTAHSEDMAVSRQENGEAEQLRTLLGLKLTEKFAEFQAMKNEAADAVFREHYRDLLDFIFDLLQQQGIQFR